MTQSMGYAEAAVTHLKGFILSKGTYLSSFGNYSTRECLPRVRGRSVKALEQEHPVLTS